ncbi:hypothetical protein KCP69_02785 [Salmonella enterica subsp. enterica]|nr:hypothetical protein KCP69_02785 [Salmonella enterica subsp. enterica]
MMSPVMMTGLITGCFRRSERWNWKMRLSFLYGCRCRLLMAGVDRLGVGLL